MKEASISDSSCARTTRLHAKSLSQNQVKGNELQSIKLKRERNKVVARNIRMKAKERVENMIDELHSLQEENKQLKKALAGTGHQPVPLTDLIDYNIDVPHRFQNALRQIASSSSTCGEPPFFVCSDRSEQRPIVHVSKAFALLSGHQVHEIIGKKAEEFIQSIADREGQAIIVRKDNSTVWVDVQEARMSDAVGRHFLSLYACEPLNEV